MERLLRRINRTVIGMSRQSPHIVRAVYLLPLLPYPLLECNSPGRFQCVEWFMKSSFHFLQHFCATTTWLWVAFWELVLGYKLLYSNSNFNRVTGGCDFKFLWAPVHREFGFSSFLIHKESLLRRKCSFATFTEKD